MDAVMIDAMIVEAVRAERERIKRRLETTFLRERAFWVNADWEELRACVEEDSHDH